MGGAASHSILSERDVIHFLLDHIESVADVVTKSLEQLEIHIPCGGAKQSTLVSITTSQTVREGFRKMQQLNVSSVAVVDEKEGVLVGNLSVSDLRDITAETIQTVDNTVRDFMGGQFPAPLTADTSETLAEVMRKTVDAKKQRIYIVDSSGKPLRVVTHSHMLQALLTS